MIGLVLVTHGRLAQEFLAALEHVMGPQKQTAAVCIAANDAMEQRGRDSRQRASRVTERAARALDAPHGRPARSMEKTRKANGKTPSSTSWDGAGAISR